MMTFWSCSNGIASPPQVVFSTLENFSAMAMIEQGMGMSIMNDLITHHWNFNVVKLPLDPPQSIDLGIAIPSIKNVSPAAKRFIDYAVQQLRKTPGPSSNGHAVSSAHTSETDK